MSNELKNGSDELKSDLASLKEGVSPSRTLADQVMQQVALRPAPARDASLWRALWTVRTVTLRFRYATALPLIVVGLLGVPVATRLAARRAIDAQASAPVRHDALVRFAVAAKDARQVSLVGDFNGWSADAAPLVEGRDGIWTLTVPLGEGSWSYAFVVDGKVVVDPLADAVRPDGFGGMNAVVRVSAQRAAPGPGRLGG